MIGKLLCNLGFHHRVSLGVLLRVGKIQIDRMSCTRCGQPSFKWRKVEPSVDVFPDGTEHIGQGWIVPLDWDDE